MASRVGGAVAATRAGPPDHTRHAERDFAPTEPLDKPHLAKDGLHCRTPEAHAAWGDSSHATTGLHRSNERETAMAEQDNVRIVRESWDAWKLMTSKAF